MAKVKNLKGFIHPQTKIEVLEFIEIKNHAAYWKCKCSCGKEFIARGADISNGHTSSCGCKRNEKIKKIGLSNKNKYIIDLTNQRFGKLLVLEKTDQRNSSRSVIWKCQCDCGNIAYISGACLQEGQISCGKCLTSKGENKIAQLLKDNNIPFEQQKTFNDCRFPDTNYLAKFDFWVNNKYIIEYDGIQHFDVRFGWNKPDIFEKTQIRDNFKNNWCKEHNIPIIRISYKDYNNLSITDLLL